MTKLIYVNVLLEIILKNYFFNSRCILVFTDNINKIEFVTTIPIICINVVNKRLNSNLIFQHYGCQDIIISHQNATEIFIQFENLIRLHNERFNMRKFIIIDNTTDIFNTKELKYVSDFLVITRINFDDGYKECCNEIWITNETYILTTHLYNNQTKISELKILDKWFSENSSFLFGYNLFPDKLSNQKGQQLKIGTFTYEPYSIVDNESFHGTETSFIFEFVKKYNLTPDFTIIGDELWGEIYSNWTGTGLMGSLVEDVIDVGYAAMYTWEEYYNFLDYTKPLTRTGITCLVPAPKLAPGWLTPLYSFSWEMWIAIFVIFVFSTIALTFILYFQYHNFNLNDSLMTIIRVHLLQSLTLAMDTNLVKYFVILNLVYVLLVSSSYSSGLASVMTVPRYEKAIKTVKDLAASNLPWGAPTDAWLISLKHVEEEYYKVVKSHFIVKNEEELRLLSKMQTFGFSLERLPYGHFAVGPYIKGDIISDYKIMQQDLYWEQCIFMIRKNSVLLPLFDSLILRVFEAGLEAYWENQIVSQYMDMSVQRGIVFRIQDRGIVKLKWFHVEGAFGILLLGFIVSTAIFLLEILTHTRTKSLKYCTNL